MAKTPEIELRNIDLELSKYRGNPVYLLEKDKGAVARIRFLIQRLKEKEVEVDELSESLEECRSAVRSFGG